jgi:hypothetical protein
LKQWKEIPFQSFWPLGQKDLGFYFIHETMKESPVWSFLPLCNRRILGFIEMKKKSKTIWILFEPNICSFVVWYNAMVAPILHMHNSVDWWWGLSSLMVVHVGKKPSES